MKPNTYIPTRPRRWLFLVLPVLLALLLGLRPSTLTRTASANLTLSAATGKIAFSSARDGNAEIYIMNANGSNPLRLTNNPAYDAEPSWSPDGSQIVFRSDRDGGNNEIYVMNANGSNQTRLTNNPAHDYQPTWSPGGGKIAFVREQDGNQDIYSMTPTGGDQTNLTNSAPPVFERDPAWSPASNRIAFSRNEAGHVEVYVMNANGSNQINLTNFPTAADEEPTWSPNGAKIAFISYRDGGDSEIFVMDANGSNPTNLTDTSGTDYQPTWSPDGSQIAFTTDRNGNNEIYAMNTNGSNQTNLTTHPALDYLPDWGPEAAVEDDDGVPADVEDDAPNDGDGNDDGVPDSEQENVASFPNSLNGNYVTLEEINGAQLSDVQAIANPAPATAPDVDFPIGFLDFRIEGVEPDGTAVLQLFLENDAPIDTYYKYGPRPENPTDHWYEFLYDGTTGVKFQGDEILLHFKDGERGDDDLAANGVIIDAGTLADCIKVQQIEITGSNSVQAGQILDLQIKFIKQAPTDPEPSNPKTFQWSTDGLISGQGTRQAQYRWNTATPPTHTVSATVKNCESTRDPGTATSTKTIAVTSSCTNLTGVTISGPNTGTTGQTYTFNATVQPASATNPTFQWSPAPTSGQGTAQASYVWNNTGNQTVSVSASNCSGSGTANASHPITITPGCTTLGAVTINGPANGVTGQTYHFTAEIAPPSATTPITYNWSPPPLTGQGTSQASYVWDAAGDQTISVSVSNCGGSGSAGHNHPITITQSCTNLSSVTISGPSNGIIGQTYSFTAGVAPPSATDPFTYTWSPAPSSGQGTSQATYVWNSTGNQTLSVSVSNCGGNGTASSSYTVVIIQSCTQLTAVAINGPTSGVTGQTYTFTTAPTPAAATPPVSYVWAPEPSGGQGTATASYFWSSAGDQTVSVSAGNCGGAGIANKDHSITITAPPANLRVVDEANQPMAGVSIFRNGTPAGQTDANGALAIPTLQQGDELVAQKLVYEHPGAEESHEGWGYRVYLTNVAIPRSGEPSPTVVTNPANTILTLKKTNTLIGLHLVVSVEWDANPDYLAELRRGFNAASLYLYDASNGQIRFEEVNIYENAKYWTDADFNIYARNTFRPVPTRGRVRVVPPPYYAFGTAQFGRYSSRTGSNAGNWTAPDAFRTIVRQLAHHTFEIRSSEGFYGRQPPGVACTSPAIMTNNTADLNATLMAYQYNATEFAMYDETGFPGLWSATCTETAQWDAYHMSDWQTLVTLFGDRTTPARWTITTPVDRGGVVAGPHVFPLSIWSEPASVDETNTGVCLTPPTYRATYGDRLVVGAWTQLSKPASPSPRLIEQGETGANGEISVLGAAPGDTVTIVGTVDTGGFVSIPIPLIRLFQVACATQRSAAADPVIELELEEAAFALNVSTSPGDAADEVQITVTADTLLNAPPTVTLHQVTGIPQPVIMQFNSASQSYHGTATLNAALGTSATLAVSASDTQGKSVEAFAAFDMTPVAGDQDTTVLSADGQAELFVPAGALSADGRISIEATQLPGPLPVGLVALSGPYALSAESGLILSNPADLILYYLDVGGTLRQADLATARIYRWTGNEWAVLDGTNGRDSVLASINDFGTYALLAKVAYPVYLPVGMQ